MPVMSREDLDLLTCAADGCTSDAAHDALFLHARCHMAAPLWVEYKHGNLLVTCSVCKKEVVTIEVPSSRAGVT